MTEPVKSSMTVKGQADPQGYRIIAALIEGAINSVPTAFLEFVARDKALDLGTLVGTDMGFWVEDENSKRQPFWGTCISAESLGTTTGEGRYVVEIRPWLWFLTRSKNNRIYQAKSTTDIVKDILGEYGFSGDLKVNHSDSDKAREYCVQYGETDLNFLQRLLEEEGYYYYFEYDDGGVKMVLADQTSTHGSAGEDDKYYYSDEKTSGAREQILTWQAVEKAVTGKVTLRDYDFTKPSSDLTATSVQPSGSHGHKSYESYIYPGKYADVSAGDKRAAALIEEQAAGHQTWSATGTMVNLNVGKIFEIVDHPRHESASENGFMVTNLTQFLSVNEDSIIGGSALKSDPRFWGRMAEHMADIFKAGPPAVEPGKMPSPGDMLGFFTSIFGAVKKTNPYRGPSQTTRPRMIGVQTAVVTGASGDEITVDKYGRIKVQFHWDRDGKKDDKTTCWVRTMMPWTGKNWGSVALPRVGQEVVIQFEEGDPDRPICVGMLYNADTMPPYELPGNATRTGTKTNSSKGGGGYNELMFEDKAGDELVRFMAQKDFVQNTQNSAHIKVGYGHGKDVKAADAQDKKSMKLEVQNHLDEIVETGDHSFTVQDGNQTIVVEKDQDISINKNAKLTVKDDYDIKVSSGNMTTSVSLGNISVSAASGKIDMNAAQSITFKCGGSTLKMTPEGIEIKSPMVTIKANVSLSAEGGASAELKSGGMTTIKGSMVMIN